MRNRPTKAIDVLRARQWKCAECDQPHQGLIDLAAFAPDAWKGDHSYEPNSELRTDGDFLSEDFCVIEGRYFMVRCVLEIPVHELDQKFGYGCWGSLSRANFDLFIDHFDEGSYQGLGPWTSYLCNQLSDYIGDKPEGCWLFPQLDRQRPTLRVADDDHPLARDQRDGISPERMLEIYKTYGHEMQR